MRADCHSAIRRPRIEDLDRRAFMTGALAVPFLIACGRDDESPSAEPGAMLVTRDMFGETTLPRAPRRIIAGDSVTLGNMLAVEVTPVGTAVNRNSLPDYLSGQLQGVADITAEDNNSIDLEKAAALNPDLIVAYGGQPAQPFNAENCQRYRQITATFCYEYGYSTEEEIKTNLTEVARVLGRAPRAADVIAQYDGRAAELRRRLAAAGLADKPVSVLRVMQSGYSLRFGAQESIVFRAIGAFRPENQRDYKQFRLAISLENLRDIDGYAVYVYVDNNAGSLLSPLVDSPLYKTLDAVKNGRMFFVSSGVWNSVDLIGAMRIMDDVERTLIAPAEGR